MYICLTLFYINGKIFLSEKTVLLNSTFWVSLVVEEITVKCSGATKAKMLGGGGCSPHLILHDMD